MGSASLESALAGFLASTSAGLFFPLEVIKVHLMVADGRSKNFTPHFRHSMQVLRSLYAEGGILRLYRGWYLSTANSITWGVYFYVYQLGKDNVGQALSPHHPELAKLMVAFQASVVTALAMNPLMVIKTRVMLLKYRQVWHQDIVDSVRKLWRLDGPMGFFNGLVPALFLSLNGTLHMYFYETFKEHFNPEHDNYKTSAIGAISKLLSSALLHPFQTLKYRMQQEQHSGFILKRGHEVSGEVDRSRLFAGLKECIQSTYQYEGIRGFYKGMAINLARLLPANAVFFLVYENTLKFFGR